LNGLLHRVGDPAIELMDGTRWWCLEGKPHRVGGPAIQFANGTCLWYLDGVLQRSQAA
jgi:hypothetical protein